MENLRASSIGSPPARAITERTRRQQSEVEPQRDLSRTIASIALRQCGFQNPES
jgi:hypothetical protein